MGKQKHNAHADKSIFLKVIVRFAIGQSRGVRLFESRYVFLTSNYSSRLYINQ